MTKPYIAPTDAIAAGIHDGTVTEIVIAMRWPGYCSLHNPANAEPCPYQPGDRIAVRENKPMSRQGPATIVVCQDTDCREIDGKWQWVCRVERSKE